MVYEANARVQDPVYGCVGAISSLQHQLDGLRAQLAQAQAEWILDSDDVTYPAATIHMKAGSIAISTVLIMDVVSQ
ncbi:LOB domain-containing protein 4 [Senna tora]|uniref:LOB domain-containing protein 4 n=1 Tax=Senna tora TaxID=362788 RepID=A0A834U199_9FABA|nr:LOB domain-containing protein 4 [Senna tora]